MSGSAIATPVIALERVHKRYGDFVAVHEAHFDIDGGEFFSMLGPSGCGKTTLLRMIAGFESVSSGRIRLEGADVSSVPPYRRNVNTVFQHYALFPHMSVYDNVAFGPRTKGLDKEEVARRVDRLLQIVRLSDFAARRPSQLSGGQQQRVALARALVNYPSALLLDEPLSALDAKLRQAMQIELKRIQREVGITFVFVTHDQEEALAMSDRIAVMSAGRVEQVGTPEAIYDSPATPFVAGFIGDANLLAGTLQAVTGEVADLRLAADRSVRAQPSSAGLRPGDAAMLMVRPERVHLSREQPGAPEVEALPGTLVEFVFQGPIIRCVLRDDADTELIAHVSTERREERFAVGDRLWASWERKAARILAPRV